MPGTAVGVAGATTENLLKGLPKLWAKDRVNDGVERRVDVAQPGSQDEERHRRLLGWV